MPSLIDSILDDTGPINTPAPTPVTTGTGTPVTTTNGTPKTFPTGVKSISISGPPTVNVGTPAVYKVSGSLGYSSWVGQDPNLTIHFVVYTISAVGSLVLSSNNTSVDDKYTFTPTTAGDYQIVAYAKKSNECDDATSCPRVSVRVTVTGTVTGTATGTPTSTTPPPSSTSTPPSSTTPPPSSTTVFSSPGCPNPTEVPLDGQNVTPGSTVTVPYILDGMTCVQSCPPGFTKHPMGDLCDMLAPDNSLKFVYTSHLKTAPYTGGSISPPTSTNPPTSTTPPTPTSPPTSTSPPSATLSTDDFKNLNTSLKTVNSKLNSLYNQMLGLGRTTTGMNTQLTSIENVTNNVNTMMNTLVTSLQNTPTEEVPSQEGGYRRTSRRNKTKRRSTFRKKASKL